MKKKICATCLLLSIVLLLSGCAFIPDATQEPKTQSKAFYEYFDTECAVFSYAGDTEKFEESLSLIANFGVVLFCLECYYVDCFAKHIQAY